jgi:ABC-type lipoprotein export system ATPase subunit
MSGVDPSSHAESERPADAPLIELRDIFKDYKGLRPLRITALDVRPGARVAIAGLDRISAEVFLNLLSGAILPDRGEVRIFGQSTTMIRDDVEWMASLDRFGIVTERAMLLDGFSIAQNLVLPMSLDIDPISDEMAARMRQIAGEVQLPDTLLDRPAVRAAPPIRMRLHLGRALALDPRVLLMEHPTATLPREDVAAFGEAVRTLVQARGIAMLALTEDDEFAEIVATERYKLQPGTGALAPVKRRWWPF